VENGLGMKGNPVRTAQTGIFAQINSPKVYFYGVPIKIRIVLIFLIFYIFYIFSLIYLGAYDTLQSTFT